MNARKNQLELRLEGRQIEEAVSCVFHTLLLHRSTGKFTYKAEGNYSIGVVGTEDIDCHFIDLTYVRLCSDQLSQSLRREVSAFRDALRQQGAPSSGLITLEFYQKRKRQTWFAQEDLVPWEIWDLHLDVLQLTNETEHEKLKETVGEALAELVFTICNNMNRPQLYVPKMPVQSDLPLVFDTSLADVQPYLYRIRQEARPGPHRGLCPPPGSDPSSSQAGPGLTTTFKKLLKDTLSM